jgi:hypothetical protein
MRIFSILGIFILAVILSSCGSKQNGDNSAKMLDEFKVLKTRDIVTENDFIYRLVTEKAEYNKNESIKIYAELEYVGSKEEVVIYHAASPFHFPMIEKTRNYEIGYPMQEPLISTTLKKGQPLHQEYRRIGGNGSQEDGEYVKFMKSFLEDGFPTGYFVINGYADFYVENMDETKKAFKINGKIDFKVY